MTPTSVSATRALFDNGLPSAREALARVFGHADFRGRQGEVIDHVVSGGDAVVLFPTGAGKSLCYQIPALCRAGTAIVVTKKPRKTSMCTWTRG